MQGHCGHYRLHKSCKLIIISSVILVCQYSADLLCRSDFTPVRNGLQLLKADASMDASFLVRFIFTELL